MAWSKKVEASKTDMEHTKDTMTTPTMKKFESTTRWTAPEPEGLEKIIQDTWDEKRETQVKTAMKYDADMAFKNFCGALKQGIDAVSANPVEGGLMFVYGSYDRTDYYKKNGDQNTASERELATGMRRLGVDKMLMINRYLKSKNVIIVKHGIRTTGTLRFTDGSMEVIDPTKGFQLGGGDDDRQLEAMKPVETLYAIIMAKPTAMSWKDCGMDW